MHGEGVFFQAFVYLGAAVLAVPLAKRLGLGSVLGYLIAGVLIGPFVLGLVGTEGEDVMHFAEFGVVMMLFLIGLELQPILLWRMRAPILGQGGLQVSITTVLIAAIAMAFGLAWQTALAVGMTLALSSTAIVLQTLDEKNLMKTDAGQSSFSVLLFQDIAVIPMLALLPLLSLGATDHGDAHHGDAHHGDAHAHEAAAHATTWVDGLAAWQQTLVVLAAVAAIVLAGRFLIRPALRVLAGTRLRELFTAGALLLIIGIALLMSKVGLSPALGTFLAGVVLADSEFRHELESDIEPFKGLLLGLFFISVGASIDFGLIGEHPGRIVLLVAILTVTKMAVLFGIGAAFKMSLDQNLLFTFGLAQGGEFAFVLCSFALQNGVLTTDVASPLIAVVALSMVLTPLLLLVAERGLLPRIGTRESVERKDDAIHEDNPVIIAGFGRFGHIVGRLLVANGVRTTVLDRDSDHVELLRKLGIKVFYGDATRHDLLHSAGAGNAKLLILGIDGAERRLDIVHTVKKHFPHLKIMSRASGRAEAYDLLDAGVDHVYRDTLDTSLRVGIDALRELGFRSNQALRAARTFRRHDEQSLRELAAMRHDQAGYINEARRRISDLEQILLADLDALPESADAAWDSESMRREMSGIEG